MQWKRFVIKLFICLKVLKLNYTILRLPILCNFRLTDWNNMSGWIDIESVQSASGLLVNDSFLVHYPLVYVSISICQHFKYQRIYKRMVKYFWSHGVNAVYSGLFCPYKANVFQAWCKYTKNGRFKVSFPKAYFLSGLSNSILKICISFIYIKLGEVAKSGQSTPEMFQQEFSESQFCQLVVKKLWHFRVIPSALIWQINQNIIEKRQVPPTWVIPTCGNCLLSAKNLAV